MKKKEIQTAKFVNYPGEIQRKDVSISAIEIFFTFPWN